MKGRWSKHVFWILGAFFLLIGMVLQFAIVPSMSRLLADYERVPRLHAESIGTAAAGTECFVSARVSAKNPAIFQVLVAYVKERYAQRGKKSSWSVIESHRAPLKIDVVSSSAESTTVEALLDGEYELTGARVIDAETNVRYRGLAAGDLIEIHGVVQPGAVTRLVGKMVMLGPAESITADQRGGLKTTRITALGALAMSLTLFSIAWLRREKSR